MEDILRSLTVVVNSKVPTAEVEKVHTYTLAALLDKAGYRSGHVGAQMAAAMIIDFMRVDSMKPVKDVPAVDSEEEEEGFCHMTKEFAYFLSRFKSYDWEISKDLSKCMVELWRIYGVSYHQLKDICKDYYSLSELLDLLNKKVDEGKKKPNLCSFRCLSELTIKHFDKSYFIHK